MDVEEESLRLETEGDGRGSSYQKPLSTAIEALSVRTPVRMKVASPIDALLVM